jgi:2-amino-4-hydroxy-6-hydroxymethyldihydropteridine diphosphokinase
MSLERDERRVVTARPDARFFASLGGRDEHQHSEREGQQTLRGATAHGRERTGGSCETAESRLGPVERAFVGLGANLGDRERAIREALRLLDADEDVTVAAVSTLGDTDPVGVVDQPRFLNGVAALDTELVPRALLDLLLSVERELGRVRGERWGPRTIDLDLLLYGNAVVDEPGLTLPHPRLHERRFVLEPLSELAPELEVPGRGTVADLLAGLD